MLRKMKLISLKHSLIRIISFFVIGCIGMCLYGNYAFHYINGPVKINNVNGRENQYVQYDQNDIKIYECILREENQYSIFNKTDYYYYSVRVDDGYTVLRVPESMKKEMDEFCENKSNDKVFYGMTCNLPENVKLRFDSYLNMNGIDDSQISKMELDYMINTDIPTINDVILSALSILLILIAIGETIFIIFGGRQFAMHRQIKKDGIDDISIVERDYEISRFFCKKFRVGKIYTYLFKTNGYSLIKNSDIIWIYECSVKDEKDGVCGNQKFSGIRICSESNCQEIVIIGKTVIKNVLDYYAECYPQIIVGYRDELNDIYNKSKSEFKEIIYNKNIHTAV